METPKLQQKKTLKYDWNFQHSFYCFRNITEIQNKQKITQTKKCF